MTFEEKRELRNAFNDIPGTYVLTPEHSKKGYHLNMFCMTLNEEVNRKAFRANEAKYLDQFPMSEEQKKAVLNREWLKLLQLGGNIYYTFKLAIFDRRNMQYVGGAMSGVSEQEFTDMMIAGGRPVEGNLYTSEEK